MLPSRWPTLQPLLDAALDADPADRAALLQGLRQQDPELAQQLDELLASHDVAQGEGFLQQTPESGLFASPLAGQRLGPWLLIEPIGEGGMGSVWLARRDDGRFQGQAAVKLLNLTLAGAMRQERFRREGHILARLMHPHIAHLLDAGVTPSGQPYLVLEHVQGLQIDAHCSALALDVPARIRLFITLLGAVAHAHQHLVVHRDIKPSNVMVNRDGQVKLLDFGIAKMLAQGDTTEADAAALAPLTQQAGAMLSPGYAAPEQLHGGAITTATDVYALGVLLYGLLTGQHPTLRAGQSVAEALRRTMEQDAPRLSAAAGDLPLKRQLRGDLDNIVAKALQAAPERRYASAAAFADDLQRHLAHQPVLARTPSLAYRAARFVQRQRVPVAVAGVAALAVAVVGMQAWQQRQAASLNQARAQSVDGLLQSLFQGMGPDAAASRTFSARELLDRAQAFLDSGKDLDPHTRRSARLRMAQLYGDIGAHAEARAAYAAEAAQAAAAREPDAQAWALWGVITTDISLRDIQGAAQALQTLDSVMAASPVSQREMTARQQLLHGELALATRRTSDAVQALDRASSLLQPEGELELAVRVAKAQGMAARLAGQRSVARDHLQRAVVLQGRRADASPMDRLALTLQIGTLDNWLGRFATAVQLLQPAHAEMVSRLGAKHALVASSVAELALAELRQGHHDAARGWIRQLRGATGPADAWRDDHADLLEARIQLYSGNAGLAEPELLRLLKAMERDEGRVSAATEPLRRFYGEALLRLGRASAAEKVLRETEANQIQLTNPQHNSVAITRVLLACARARQGDVAAAGPVWQAASPLLDRELGSQHPFALAAASYAALADPAATAERRAALAARVDRELGWQAGAAALARLLRQAPGGVDWAQLPVVL